MKSEDAAIPVLTFTSALYVFFMARGTEEHYTGSKGCFLVFRTLVVLLLLSSAPARLGLLRCDVIFTIWATSKPFATTSECFSTVCNATSPGPLVLRPSSQPKLMRSQQRCMVVG